MLTTSNEDSDWTAIISAFEVAAGLTILGTLSAIYSPEKLKLSIAICYHFDNGNGSLNGKHNENKFDWTLPMGTIDIKITNEEKHWFCIYPPKKHVMLKINKKNQVAHLKTFSDQFSLLTTYSVLHRKLLVFNSIEKPKGP